MTQTGSNRRGQTRDTHGTRHRSHTMPVYFACPYCPSGADTWTVGGRQTVVEAQAQHAATHPLSLRLAVEAVVAEVGGTYTQTLRPPSTDRGTAS